MENREIKAQFYRALGAGMKKDGLVASNSSSMGPGLLGEDFAAGGGDRRNMLNLHFFSPAEHPMMQLVEIIAAKETAPDAVATAHAFVRSINKTPVILQDGSPGFLVNAGLAAYMLEAEKIYREGTPAAAIDEAMRADDLPDGPLRARRSGRPRHRRRHVRHHRRRTRSCPFEPLVWKLREQKRFGIKSGAGVYDYKNGKKQGEWPGLAALVPQPRQPCRRLPTRSSSAARRRSTRKARELCDRKIVASEEECDLAFVFGIGFAMYLGGPIFYGKQRGWDRS